MVDPAAAAACDWTATVDSAADFDFDQIHDEPEICPLEGTEEAQDDTSQCHMETTEGMLSEFAQNFIGESEAASANPYTAQAVTQCDYTLMGQPLTDSVEQVIMQSDDTTAMQPQPAQIISPYPDRFIYCWQLGQYIDKYQAILLDTVQFWNRRFFPELLLKNIESLTGKNRNTITDVTRGVLRGDITKYLSDVTPTPLKWFLDMDASLFENFKTSVCTDKMDKFMKRILSNCPGYQTAIRSGDYKLPEPNIQGPRGRPCPKILLKGDFLQHVRDYIFINTSCLHLSLRTSEQVFDEDTTCPPDITGEPQEGSSLSQSGNEECNTRAEKNKVMVLQTVQINNAKFHQNLTSRMLSQIFGLSRSTIQRIQNGKAREAITLRLSSYQPTPVDWFGKMKEMYFENVQFWTQPETLSSYIDILLLNCSDYQNAISSGDYMHKPLPPEALEYTSYWKTYMPSLKDVVGDLTLLDHTKETQDGPTALQVLLDHTKETQDGPTALQVLLDHTKETQDGPTALQVLLDHTKDHTKETQDRPALSENDRTEMILPEFQESLLDGGNQVPSESGSEKCMRKSTRQQHDPIGPLEETIPKNKRTCIGKEILPSHVDRAKENRKFFEITVQLYNSKHFHFPTKKDLETSFPDTKERTIRAIIQGQRRYEITKFLSKSQPTPVDWFTSVPAIFFERLLGLKMDGAQTIFEQSQAYQVAIRGCDYMHKPLPRIKPEGFSYWKTYMPSLQGVEGDLTPIRE